MHDLQVAMFVSEFAALRGAAVRFANGEDPSSIRESMAAEQEEVQGPLNRAQRRAKKRKGRGAVRSRGGGGGFR